MNQHRGKSFLAPPRLIRRERAGYFPNLHGYTLEDPGGVADTTDVLRGRVSLVSVFSGKWADDQTRTFVTDDNDLFLRGGRGGASGRETEEIEGEGKAAPIQRVEVNLEEGRMRAWLVRMSVGGLQRMRPASEWQQYFVVRRGVTASVREHLGMANGKVGYVYLTDEECRVRWAGCGDATEGERESLAKAARRLVEGGGMKVGQNETAVKETEEKKPERRERVAMGASG